MIGVCALCKQEVVSDNNIFMVCSKCQTKVERNITSSLITDIIKYLSGEKHIVPDIYDYRVCIGNWIFSSGPDKGYVIVKDVVTGHEQYWCYMKEFDKLYTKYFGVDGILCSDGKPVKRYAIVTSTLFLSSYNLQVRKWDDKYENKEQVINKIKQNVESILRNQNGASKVETVESENKYRVTLHYNNVIESMELAKVFETEYQLPGQKVEFNKFYE